MKRFKKYLFIMLLVVAGGFLGFYGFTFAKYVSNSVWDYYLKSKGFYFSSDYLGTSAIKNVNNQWDGGSVHFNVKNSLNDATVTNYDIDYRVTCTIMGDVSSHAECHMGGTSSNMQDGVLSAYEACTNNTDDEVDVSSFNKTNCELNGYDWVNQVATQDLYFDIVKTDSNYELGDVTVNITATSTSSYSKTLSGDFVLHKISASNAKVSMDYKNYSNYGKLIISNSYTSNKCVRVTWDASKLIINAEASDFSSYGTDSNGYINEIKFNIGSKDSLNYIFYKKDFGASYGVNEFLLEETSGC